MTDVATTIEQAQTPENFDVFAFLNETVYPTEDVTIYRDVISARKWTELKKAQDASNDEKGVDNSDELATLTEKIKASGMTFTLRGLPPYEVEALVGDDAPKGDYEFFQDHVLIAKSIVGVKDAKGNPDRRTWTHEDISKLRGLITAGEFGKLVAGAANVNFTAAVFNQATDAGFPG
jgi:hypothetical protein